MTETITMIRNILLSLVFGVPGIILLNGAICFFHSCFLKKHISKYIIFGISLIFSFLFSYLIYWSPVWFGLSHSDQNSSWAPIYITVGIIGGLCGTFVGLTFQKPD